MAFRYGLTMTAVLELDEHQLGALDALAGYGHKGFLEVFYKHMGEAYMRPHEAGLISLFDRIRDTVPSALSQIGDARRLLTERERARQAGRSFGAYSLPPRAAREMVEGDL